MREGETKDERGCDTPKSHRGRGRTEPKNSAGKFYSLLRGGL